ncbi:hypothetical protein ACFX15_005873 [Malus domestica]
MSAPETTHHRRLATGGSGASDSDDSDDIQCCSVERVGFRRICHLGLEGGGGTDPASGVPIDFGCSCKGDLGAAYKQCAETWFKITGDT